MTTDPQQRLVELLETLPADERKDITRWLLGRPQSLDTLHGWTFQAPPRRLTGALPVGEDTQLVTIRLPSDRHAALRDWCAEHGFTMAAVVRGLVERFLEQQGRE